MATDGTEDDIHEASLNLGMADLHTVCYRKRPCIIKYHLRYLCRLEFLKLSGVQAFEFWDLGLRYLIETTYSASCVGNAC